MSDPVLAPHYWKGENYRGNPLALRILIIGESHNGRVDEPFNPYATCKVITERMEFLEYGNFFGGVERIIVGRKKLASHEVRKFWKSVAFLNFATRLVPERTKARVAHFAECRPRFAEAVRDLEPQLICFFSRVAWSNRPGIRDTTWRDAFGREPEMIDDRHTVYPYGDQSALAVSFNHPRGLMKAELIWTRHFRAAYQRRLTMEWFPETP